MSGNSSLSTTASLALHLTSRRTCELSSTLHTQERNYLCTCFLVCRWERLLWLPMVTLHTSQRHLPPERYTPAITKLSGATMCMHVCMGGGVSVYRWSVFGRWGGGLGTQSTTKKKFNSIKSVCMCVLLVCAHACV